MEPQSSNGRDGAGDVAAQQDVQQHAMPTVPIMPDLDVPSLDVPNLGEITSTFEPITDVPPSDAVAASSPVVPQYVSDSPESDVRGNSHDAGVSDSPESDIRGGAQDARVSVSPESVTRGTADSARVSFSGESDNRGEVRDAGVSVSPESDNQGDAGGVGMSDSPESDTLGEQEAGLGSAASAASAADPESLPKAKPALFTAGPKEPGLSTQEMSEVHASAYARSIPHPTGAAAAERPPQIPLAPVKRVRAQFNPLADGLLYLVVFVGGFLGTAMRYGLSLAFPAPEDASGFLGAFRWPTFGANMLACFLLAVITVCVSQASWLTRRVKQVISNGAGLGLCGGCSTLSTLGIEELTSFHDGEIGGAVTYVLATFVCGVLCSIIGVKVGLLLTARRKSQVLREAVRNAALSKDGSVPVIEGRTLDVNDGSDAAEALIAADAPIVVDKPVAVPGGDGDGRDVRDTAVVSVSEETGTGIPAFEPAPITDEIPLVGDLMTGEVRVATEAERDANIGAVSTGEFPAVPTVVPTVVPAVTDAALPDAATSDAASNIVPDAALAEQPGEGVER